MTEWHGSSLASFPLFPHLRTRDVYVHLYACICVRMHRVWRKSSPQVPCTSTGAYLNVRNHRRRRRTVYLLIVVALTMTFSLPPFSLSIERRWTVLVSRRRRRSRVDRAVTRWRKVPDMVYKLFFVTDLSHGSVQYYFAGLHISGLFITQGGLSLSFSLRYKFSSIPFLSSRCQDRRHERVRTTIPRSRGNRTEFHSHCVTPHSLGSEPPCTF